MYKLILESEYIRRLPDNTFIPNDPQNRDWQEYQAWLAVEGNVPEAAE